jgi:energy-coupling factor transporter transmembrane protein EcfT
VLILDEPSAGLDDHARGALYAALAHAPAAARIVITHDAEEAALLADRLIVLDDGRVVYDGAVDAVLGDVDAARRLGIEPGFGVLVAHELAAVLGAPLRGPLKAHPDAVTQSVEALLLHGERHSARPGSLAPSPGPAPHAHAGLRRASTALAPLVDVRARLLASALLVTAALLSATVVVAAVVAACAAAAMVRARPHPLQLRLAWRAAIATAVTLLALQLIAGSSAPEPVLPGASLALPYSAAALRALQAAAVLWVAVAVTASSSTSDLTEAVAWWCAPLRLLGVSTRSLAFVVATSLGLVTHAAGDLARLRTAQRARGMAAPAAGAASRHRRLRARAALDAQLLPALVTASFRRAHATADSLLVRGIDPAAQPVAWRARAAPPFDAALVVGAALLVVAARASGS